MLSGQNYSRPPGLGWDVLGRVSDHSEGVAPVHTWAPHR